MFVIKKVQRFLPKSLKRAHAWPWKIFFGELARFDVGNPKRFDWNNIEDAKKSILWYENWDKATENTIELMQKLGLIKMGSVIVDWGCGVGRIASKLVERYNVTVLAVDRSIKMLRHTLSYVEPQFLSNIALATDEFVLSNANLLKNCADLVIFIEVVQHIPEPALDQMLPRIEKLLKNNGRLFVLGNKQLEIGYTGKDPSTVEKVLKRHFELEKSQITFHRYAGIVPNLLYDRRARYCFVAKRKQLEQ